ncbi:ureidoglycolate amidohydrolase [Sarracenia purpurea var. burkii]
MAPSFDLWAKETQRGTSMVVKMENLNRHDVGLAAAELALAVEMHVLESRSFYMVGTVSIFELHPGAINSIPSKSNLEIGLRLDIDENRRNNVIEKINRSALTIAQKRSIKVSEVKIINQDPPVLPDESIIKAMEVSSPELNLANKLISWVYYDSLFMAREMLEVRREKLEVRQEAIRVQRETSVGGHSCLEDHLESIWREPICRGLGREYLQGELLSFAAVFCLRSNLAWALDSLWADFGFFDVDSRGYLEFWTMNFALSAVFQWILILRWALLCLLLVVLLRRKYCSWLQSSALDGSIAPAYRCLGAIAVFIWSCCGVVFGLLLWSDLGVFCCCAICHLLQFCLLTTVPIATFWGFAAMPDLGFAADGLMPDLGLMPGLG